MTGPTPAESKQRTAEVFGRTAATYEQVVPFFAPPGRRLVELAEVSPGMSVVDLGAGRGAVTFPAADAVGPSGRVVATDLAPEMVDLLAADVAATGLSHVDVRLMDAEEPDILPASADRVLGAFMVFFLPDPAAALQRWSTILRPTGRLGLTTFPRADERWGFWPKMLDELKPPHLRSAAADDDPGPVGSPERLAATLAETGYVDVVQTEECFEVVFRDVEQWWDWVWSQGQRAALEQVPPDALPAFRAGAIARAAGLARTDGSLLLEQAVTYTLASRALAP